MLIDGNWNPDAGWSDRTGWDDYPYGIIDPAPRRWRERR